MADYIEKIIKQLRCKTPAALDERILNDAFDILEKTILLEKPSRFLRKTFIFNLITVSAAIALFVLAVMLLSNTVKQSPSKIAADKMLSAERQRNLSAQVIQAKLKKAALLYEAADVNGLITMLRTEEFPVKRIAVYYLTQIGDLHAAQALEEQGLSLADPNNVFIVAASKIRQRIKAENIITQTSVTIELFDKATDEEIPDQNIVIKHAPDDVVLVSGVTDEQGQFIATLEKGRYSISTPAWQNGNYVSLSKDFVVEGNEPDLTIQIPVAIRPILSGSLADVNNEPVKGTVTLADANTAETDPNGNFEIPQPLGQDKMFYAACAFDTGKKIGKAFIWNCSDANELKITLERLSAVEGTVVDGNALGIGNLQITLDAVVKNRIAQKSFKLLNTQTEPDGHFRFESVPTGLPLAVSIETHKKTVELPPLKPGQSLETGNIIIGTAKKIELPNDVNLTPPAENNLIGTQAPELYVAKWLNSEPLTLRQLRGRLVLLQIGIYLPRYNPARETMQKLYDKYSSRGLEIIAVHQSLTFERLTAITEQDILNYIAEYDIRFPFAIDMPSDDSPKGATANLYYTTANPAYFLIDKNGILRFSPSETNLEQNIEQLLAE